MTTQTYEDFLASKHVTAPDAGFTVDVSTLPAGLFDWQRDIVAWALNKGRAAIWADCGLGKGWMALAWGRAVCEYTGGDVLLLAPLAVATQFQREAAKAGIPVTLCKSQDDVRPGINISNYERLHLFDVSHFTGGILDESGCLKSYMSKTKRALVDAFAHTPYRLCCTATPAPNDHMELGNHSEFLGIMPANEMLARWFINDTMKMGTYRLKGHAESSFWDWIASWAVSMRKPSDLGYSDEGFILPGLELHHETVRVDVTDGAGDKLFRIPTLSSTEMHKELRRTAPARAERVAELVNGDVDQWLVWCNTDYEADELTSRIPDAVEIRGSMTIERREQNLAAFLDGSARVLVGKPSASGYGLNLQHVHKCAFIGLSYSFEQFYQALRRVYRFGQKHVVQAHVIAAETEGEIRAVVEAKLEAHERMLDGMNRSTSKLSLGKGLRLELMTDCEVATGKGWTLHLGDCVDVARGIETASVDFSVHSPPFSGLYIYSDAAQDMGNCDDDAEFFEHYGYLIPEMHRITRPGRLAAVHCKQLVNYRGRDGMAGLRDFRGDIIRAFTAHGWAYHSEVCIWKDPVIEMQRTKAHGLLHKQVTADSSFSRTGLAEYLLLFRRWPANEHEEAMVEPVTRGQYRFDANAYIGEDAPNPAQFADALDPQRQASIAVWQRYASPVWHDIRQTHVLNVQQARDDRDEKHIAPLQLDVIARALELWSNPGDLIYDPFNGIGSTGYVALEMSRRYVGSELKRQYFNIAVKNLHEAEVKSARPTLFDMSAAGL